MEDYSAYAKHYTEGGFWGAIRKNADKIPFLRDALGMFFCLRDPETPLWVKGLIVGALGYFILPLDVVPDFIPVLGWLDDAGVIAGVLGTLASAALAAPGVCSHVDGDRRPHIRAGDGFE